MQIKEEITQIVDALPEEFLNELLQYLKKLEIASNHKGRISLQLNSILLEDKEVLTKLSQ